MTLAVAILLTGCAAGRETIPVYQPPAGSNQVLSGVISGAPGRSLAVGDLVMGADGEIARHYHAGEEFLYVIGGSATVSRVGEADVTLTAGQALRIAPGTVHWGRAGPEGVRAITSWVAVDGEPLRVTVPE